MTTRADVCRDVTLLINYGNHASTRHWNMEYQDSSLHGECMRQNMIQINQKVLSIAGENYHQLVNRSLQGCSFYISEFPQLSFVQNFSNY